MKPQINKWTTIIIAVLFIGLVIIPLIRNDIGLARNPQNYMSEGWQEATQYLRSRLTPEQEAKYYQIYEEGESLDMPYVLAWWDYGFWIVREAHMPVICHPGGGKRTLVAQILLNENPEEAIAQLRQLNIKYIIIDSQTAVEKFYSLVEYTGGDLDRYYRKPSEGFKFDSVWRTSDYYNTLLARLYVLDAYGIKGINPIFKSNAKVILPDDLRIVTISGKYIDSLPEVKIFEVQ